MNENNTVDLADRARSFLANGQLENAKTIFTKLCNIDKKNEENWLMLAVINGETGEADEALDCANHAIELDETYVEAHLTRAHLLQKAGNDEEAVKSALKAVEIDSEYDEAWLFLSGIAGRLKRYQDAEQWAEKAVSLLPTSADAHTNLGNARYQLTKYAEAEESYRNALKLQPDHFQAELGLAKAVAAQNRFEEAAELLTPVLQNDPGHSDALACLASCLMQLKKEDEARRILEQIIEQDPGYVYAYLHFANLLEQRGDYLQALKILKQAKEIATDPLDVLGALAKLYHEYGMQVQAIEVCEEALALDTSNTMARFFRALAIADSNRYEEALTELRDLQAQSPDDPRILGAQASILERLGEYEKAWEIVKQFTTKGSVPTEIVNAYASMCHRFNECDEVVRLIDSILDDPDYPADYRRSLLFSVGKIHDRMKRYDLAFARMKEANELKGYRYDHNGFTDKINRLIAPGVVSQLERPDLQQSVEPAIRPVFIVGMPRSGTSLVEQILASHPQVSGGGERQEISSLTQKLPSMEGINGEYPECLASLTPELIEQVRQAYDAFTRGLPAGTTILTDKMPENFLHIVFIRMLFPDACIIHCVRNALDTCLSIYSQQFTGYHDYAYDLTDLGSHHREYQRLMKHYRDEAGIPMLEVPYEDLVRETESWIRKIVDYAGLDWDDRCLRYYEADRVTRTASYDQVKQPIYTGSVGRWKNYEKHLQPLIEALNGQ